MTALPSVADVYPSVMTDVDVHRYVLAYEVPLDFIDYQASDNSPYSSRTTQVRGLKQLILKLKSTAYSICSYLDPHMTIYRRPPHVGLVLVPRLTRGK